MATPIFLPGKLHGQRNLAGYSPRGCKAIEQLTHIDTHTHTTIKKKKYRFGEYTQINKTE